MPLGLLVCRWVPGTPDSVRVSTPHGEAAAELREVRRVFGPRVVGDLSWRGRHARLVEDAELRAAFTGLRREPLAPPK